MVRLRLSAGLFRLLRGDRYGHAVQSADPVDLKSPIEKDGPLSEGRQGAGKVGGGEVIRRIRVSS